jgi:hypothetical protein
MPKVATLFEDAETDSQDGQSGKRPNTNQKEREVGALQAA